MCQNSTALVFNDAYIGTSTGESDTAVSREVQGMGNAVAAVLLVLNVSAAATVTVKLRGKRDGMGWEDVGSTTATAFCKKVISANSVMYSQYQAIATITGTNVAAVLRGWITQGSL